MSELLRNSEFVWAIMAIIIFLLTFAIKYPYKLLTNKIKDETKRKISNKAIVLFAFGLGFLLNFVYCHYFGMIFTVQASLKYALSAIAIHSALEIKSNGKVENVFNTQEGKEVVDKATEYVNGTNETTKSTDKKKTKSESAVADFWKSVKKK